MSINQFREAVMVERSTLACVRLLTCLVLFLGLCGGASARVPDGYRGVKLGMPKAEVIKVLKRSHGHFQYDDLGAEVGELIRGDDLFRHATYRFDDSGVLVEIALEMREVLGRRKVLHIYGEQYGLNLSGLKGTREGDHLIEVKGNRLIMKKGPMATVRAAGKTP
jgi:hypothetical protein